MSQKAFKALIKPFDAPQRSVNIKVYDNFFSMCGSQREGSKYPKLSTDGRINVSISEVIHLVRTQNLSQNYYF